MSVHIKISDRNWILETMARNIAERLDYVSYDTDANPEAQIQYYLTYSTYRGRVSNTEIAYFTHLEEDQKTAERFFAAAAAVDHCVCMSNIYADMLRQKGVTNISLIPPGVDIERFDTRLRIGVIGRTYSTGRKGEALVAQLMDMAGIDWLFTGDGWPGPALNLADSEMPDFYRSLDYVLVPARYEGGPMSAIEALACGVEVIAPPVGWMPELPHIPYALNDAQDLRRVLTKLLVQKRERRAAVLERTWDGFAAKHDALFRKLLPAPPSAIPAGGHRPRTTAIALVTHGMESVAKGGPSTRIPQLQAGLARRGYNARHGSFGTLPLKGADLFHLFNVATPATAAMAMRGVRSFGQPVVFSPIYLDNRCRELWSRQVPEIFASSASGEARLPELMRLQDEARQLRNLSIPQSRSLPPSYHQKIAYLLGEAAHVIYLSRLERSLLLDATGIDATGTIVHNPVDAAQFRNGDPKLFAQTWKVRDYVVCVGRIEPRKNQLMLAAALSGTGIPLVLVGECFDQKYLETIRNVPDLELVLTGRIEAGSPMLPAALAGARVFCLPSWSEGAPLAALEAGAAGCRMVLSSFSSEPEYFRDHATFVDPSDFLGLRTALRTAYDRNRSTADRAALIEFTASEYSVERHVRRTAEVYEQVLSGTREHLLPPSPETVAAPARLAGAAVFFDATTLLNNPGRITGITRAELSLIRATRPQDNIRFVAWHDRLDQYFEVPSRLLDFKSGPGYREDQTLQPLIDIPRGSAILVQGNAWLGNIGYVRALERLVRANRLRLVLHVHDILPISQPQLFDPQQTERLTQHFERLLPVTAVLSTDSQATRRDLEAYTDRRCSLPAPISVIRLGDKMDDGVVETEAGQPDSIVQSLIAKGNFVLSVGSQLPHKNRDLIYGVWNRLVAEKGAAAPDLVIVGKAAAQTAVTTLAPHAKGKVHHLTSVNDDGLAMLYRASLFTVFPSLCEGWGLPVVESLSNGKICIACDTSSMPEIAPHVTDLIDPLDGMEWYRRVKMYAFSPQARQHREAQIRNGFRPKAWRDTLAGLLDTVRGAPAVRLSAPAWDLEMPFDFINKDHLSWSAMVRRPATGGEGASIELTVSLTRVLDGAMVMELLCGNTGQGVVEVLLDDVVIDRLHLAQQPEHIHRIAFPRIEENRNYTIRFREIGTVGFIPYRFILRSLAGMDDGLYERMGLRPLTIPPNRSIALRQTDPACQRMLASGWYGIEATSAWSMEQARLCLAPGVAMNGDVQVTLGFTVFVPGRVLFRIGTAFVHVVDVTEVTSGKYSFTIPARILSGAGSYANIDIRHMSARSPESTGASSDARVLGIRLQSVEYTIVSPAAETAAAGLFEREIMVGGWHAREAGFIWSKGTGYLRLPSDIYGGHRISLTVMALADMGLDAFVAGEPALSVRLSGYAQERLLLDIPAVPAAASGAGPGCPQYIDVALIPSGTVVPREVGINADSRALGICLQGFSLVNSRRR